MKTNTKALTRTELPIKEAFIVLSVIAGIFLLVQIGYITHIIKEFSWMYY